MIKFTGVMPALVTPLTSDEKLNVEEGETYTFDKVLFVSGENTKVGTPYVEGATVTAKCEKQGRGKKIVIFKYFCKFFFHIISN